MHATAAPPVTLKDARRNDAPRLKFKGPDGFVRELKRRVDEYFESTGKRPRDSVAMYLKTATILAWFFGTYALLLFAVTNPLLVVGLSIFLGVAVAAIGFNIQHDGGHKAYSSRQWVNRLMAMSIDLMGGSSYMWDWKHNSIHHTYTNIAGHDDDIDVGLLGRLSPQQPRLPFHRFQFIYLWFLYGFLAIKWHFFDDFACWAKGRIGEHKIKRPHGKDLAIFLGGKIVFFSMAFGIPMLLHPWWAVLSVYGIAAFTSGVVMSVVFQLAHVVEEANFPVPVEIAPGSQLIDNAWAIHQVQTTVNFARQNPFLCWLLGGLNFQIEHHLFHKICHVHYPALSKVVSKTCEDFGITYNAHNTFFAAVASHARFLFEMGRPVKA